MMKYKNRLDKRFCLPRALFLEVCMCLQGLGMRRSPQLVYSIVFGSEQHEYRRVPHMNKCVDWGCEVHDSKDLGPCA